MDIKEILIKQGITTNDEKEWLLFKDIFLLGRDDAVNYINNTTSKRLTEKKSIYEQLEEAKILISKGKNIDIDVLFENLFKQLEYRLKMIEDKPYYINKIRELNLELLDSESLKNIYESVLFEIQESRVD